MWFSAFIAAAVAYLLGNLNGAVCMSQLKNDDVRSHGSGNAGLTNYIRNFGAASALFVVAIDMGKAALACQAGGLILSTLIGSVFFKERVTVRCVIGLVLACAAILLLK